MRGAVLNGQMFGEFLHNFVYQIIYYLNVHFQFPIFASQTWQSSQHISAFNNLRELSYSHSKVIKTLK